LAGYRTSPNEDFVDTMPALKTGGYMKNKLPINIILVISSIVFVALSLLMIIRNIPLGIQSVIIMTILNAFAITLLIVAISQKRKQLIMSCRVLFIAWLVFAINLSFSSANEDATLIMAIYAVSGVLILLFGILRHNKK